MVHSRWATCSSVRLGRTSPVARRSAANREHVGGPARVEPLAARRGRPGRGRPPPAATRRGARPTGTARPAPRHTSRASRGRRRRPGSRRRSRGPRRRPARRRPECHVVHRQQQLGLAPDAGVDGVDRHPGQARDVGDGRAGVARGGEQLAGGDEHRAPGGGRLLGAHGRAVGRVLTGSGTRPTVAIFVRTSFGPIGWRVAMSGQVVVHHGGRPGHLGDGVAASSTWSRPSRPAAPSGCRW